MGALRPGHKLELVRTLPSPLPLGTPSRDLHERARRNWLTQMPHSLSQIAGATLGNSACPRATVSSERPTATQTLQAQSGPTTS